MDGQFARAVQQIRRGGISRPDPVHATKEVIAPLVGGLIAMIFVPPVIIWALRRILPLPLDDNFLFLHVYPSIFTAAGCAHGVISMSTVLSTWSQTVRDKEFLVEMRLQNHDPASAERPVRGKEEEKDAGKEIILDGDADTEVDGEGEVDGDNDADTLADADSDPGVDDDAH